MDIINLGVQEVSPCEVNRDYSNSLISNLKQRKVRYEEQLASVNEALLALERNPEVAKVLELISKAK